MAIFKNLQNQSQDMSDDVSPTASDNIDPALLSEIEAGIQKITDTDFKDMHNVGTERDLKFKEDDNSSSRRERRTKGKDDENQ